MTNAELDKWAAELMGWKHDNLIHWYPSSNIDQAFMVVEKMRERGWNFNLNWQGHPGITICLAQFHKFDTGPLEHGQGSDDNPATAILLAAHQALEEREKV
jgi:hypothetical protein